METPMTFKTKMMPALLLAYALALAPAYASDGKIVGGPGGGSFRDVCPQNQYLVGVQLRSGSWVDAITPVCGVFKPGMGAQGGPRSQHGGNGGGPQAGACPVGSFVTTLRMGFTRSGNKEKYLDYVNMKCVSAKDPSQTTSVCLATGEGCYTNIDNGRIGPMGSDCPGNEAAVGLIGRSGNYVDALGVTCGPRPVIQSSGDKAKQAAYNAFADEASALGRSYRNLRCHDRRVRAIGTSAPAFFDSCMAAPSLATKDRTLKTYRDALTRCKAARGQPASKCAPPQISFSNGTCGCPSGLRGPKCDEIIVN
jgi:hypothetical protein